MLHSYLYEDHRLSWSMNIRLSCKLIMRKTMAFSKLKVMLWAFGIATYVAGDGYHAHAGRK